jgi:hypothetical protein
MIKKLLAPVTVLVMIVLGFQVPAEAARGKVLPSHIGSTLPANADKPSARFAPTYFYATATQTSISPVVTELAANFDIVNNAVTAGEYHTLAEISLQNGSHVLEIGINNDPGLYGDANTHIFTGAWVNGVFTGYNNAVGSGWVDCTGGTCSPSDAGSSIQADVGTLQQLGWLHTGGKWWGAYKGQYIGYYPDSHWSNGFTSGNVVQAFGEVVGNNSTPCSNMGNGSLPTSSSGSRINSVTYNGSTGGSPTPSMSYGLISNSSYYNAVFSGTSVRSIRYGGPGAC